MQKKREARQLMKKEFGSSSSEDEHEQLAKSPRFAEKDPEPKSSLRLPPKKEQY